jgi:hypothetical protein
LVLLPSFGLNDLPPDALGAEQLTDGHPGYAQVSVALDTYQPDGPGRFVDLMFFWCGCHAILYIQSPLPVLLRTKSSNCVQ